MLYKCVIDPKQNDLLMTHQVLLAQLLWYLFLKSLIWHSSILVPWSAVQALYNASGNFRLSLQTWKNAKTPPIENFNIVPSPHPTTTMSNVRHFISLSLSLMPRCAHHTILSRPLPISNLEPNQPWEYPVETSTWRIYPWERMGENGATVSMIAQ